MYCIVVVDGGGHIDTVMGPFVDEADAREYSQGMAELYGGSNIRITPIFPADDRKVTIDKVDLGT